MRGNNRPTGGTKSTSLAPVILGRDAQSVPRILLQRVSNLVNNLALLNKCWGSMFSAFCESFKYPSPEAYASPSPTGGEGMHRPWCHKILGTGPSMTGARGAGFVRLLRCARNDGAGNGEGLHHPWCHKILGTGPSMTGGRGAGFVRLLRCARNDAQTNNIAFKGLDVVRQYAALLERRVQTGTRARKALVVTRQTNPLGRSMIEMLGVLAIIGVLSVGGIAGYSKAMEKYKINKAMDEYTHIIFGLLEHSSDIKRNNEQTGLVDLAQSLNLIPNSWQRQSSRQITDGLDNLIQLFFTPGNMYGVSEARITFDFYIGGTRIQDKKEVSDSFSANLCFALYRDFAQQLHPIIYESQLYRTGSSKNTTYYGDAYCGGKIPCLKDLSLAEMDRLCKTCSKGNEACSLSFTF